MNSEKIIRLKLPSDFNIYECLWFLNRNFDDCIYRIDGNSIWRAIKVDGMKLLLRISFVSTYLEVEILVGHPNSDTTNYIRNFLNH